MAGSKNGDPILRAKYLDWCSARIAERFLELSPDEIYELAERATRGQAVQAGPLASLATSNVVFPEPDWRGAIEHAATAVADENTEDAASYRALIARVTEVLADEMELPTFEEWAAAYSEAPDEFDSDMLGFWKEAE
jgi:hypothetical protein